MQGALFEWEGREYEYRERSSDWYWSLGIIGVAMVAAAILLANYLFAVLIVIAIAVIALHSVHKPPLHQFRLIEHGLMIGEEFYPFDSMESFSMLEDIEGTLPPLLSIKTDRWLGSHLMIPLANVDADGIYALLLERVNEQPHRHTLADALATWLGF